MKGYMFWLYLSHLQALKGQIRTVGKQCIVGSPAPTVFGLYNAESTCVAVLMVTDSKCKGKGKGFPLQAWLA
jgi:hypothetical protein